MVVLQPYMQWVTAKLVHEVVQSQVAAAICESAAEQMEIERAAMQIHRLLPTIANDIIDLEVRWTAPDIAKELIVEMAKNLVEERRIEHVWQLAWETWSPELIRDVAWSVLVDIEASTLTAELVDEVVSEVAADCYPQVIEIQDELRRNSVLTIIQSVAREHMVNVASLRYLTSVLGSNALSLLVYKGLFERNVADTVAYLDSVRRTAVEPRHRMASEPLLAHAYNYICRRPVFEALEYDLDVALECYDVAIQRVEDAAANDHWNSCHVDAQVHTDGLSTSRASPSHVEISGAAANFARADGMAHLSP